MHEQSQPPRFETEHEALKDVEHQKIVDAWNKREGSEAEENHLDDANAANRAAKNVENQIIDEYRSKVIADQLPKAIADNQRLWDKSVERMSKKELPEGEEHLIESTTGTSNSSVTEPERYTTVETVGYAGPERSDELTSTGVNN